ncbi:nitroreductase family protein [Sedimentimonas flavescens]|uniref:nitroreductase family protein n=1 Tax=Sedimentimonas flavescens TaxID=2851012 RepID=UPI001C4A2522|nr:nitroreductase family protein [Sedimentimonas flavescens]MBW0156694.1 nitroreductase family protein [Sedimentimonas flavescens]
MEIAPGTVNPATRNDEVLRFLLTRRSRPPKTLKAPAPERAELTELLTAAARVPDHGKLEPWRFVVLERPALERLAGDAGAYAAAKGIDEATSAKGINQFADSPLCVAVISVPRPTDKVPQIEQTLSVGAACYGLLSAALAAGWGAGWLTGWVAHDRDFAASAFGLQEGEWVAGLVHIGTEGATPPERPRPDMGQIITWVEA